MSIKRVLIQQRILPFYRVPFFDKLAAAPGIELTVFSGVPRSDEGIHASRSYGYRWIRQASNRHISKGKTYICLQTNLIKCIRELRPHVLIVSLTPRFVANYLAILLMKQWKCAVIGWSLGNSVRMMPGGWSRMRRVFRLENLRLMDAMIGYSTKAARDFRAAGFPAERIFVAHNAIDTKESEHYMGQFGKDLSWVPRWKVSKRLDPEKPIILYVGKLTSQKKVDNLIRAIGPISTLCQLLVVGDGPSRNELENLARVEEADVHFLGSQFNEELARCFIASQLFILPGSGGLAINQAMSYGKAIVVGHADGTEKDLIRDGFNGLLLHRDDVLDLRERIKWCISNPASLKSMGEKSLQIVRERINLEGMVKTFVEAIDFVCSRKCDPLRKS